MLYQYLPKLYNIIKLALVLILLNLLYLHNSSAIDNITISGSNKESLPIQLKVSTFDQARNLSLLHKIVERIQLQLNDSLIFDANLEEDNNNLISKLLNITPEIIAYDISFSIKNQDDSNDKIVSVTIFDNILNKEVMQFDIATTEKEWFDGSAKISDELFYYFTGVYGYFDTSIIFVSESGKFDNRTNKIAYMSLYGDRYEEYTNGNNLVLSPSLSSDKTYLAYVSYQAQKPKTFLYNIKTKQVTPTIESKQDIMTLTPNFFRDRNNSLLLSAVYEGNSEVTLYDIQTKKTQRLTRNPATDISADFSESQNKIVFSSDRSGKAELYLMDRDGGNLKRLKFTKGTYTTPKFSPDGRYIAFTRILNNKFSIGILDTETFYTKILATDYKNDSPSWAPNSKYIMFTQVQEKPHSQKKDLSNLFIVDLNGNIIKKVNTPFDASEAYWFKN